MHIWVVKLLTFFKSSPAEYMILESGQNSETKVKKAASSILSGLIVFVYKMAKNYKNHIYPPVRDVSLLVSLHRAHLPEHFHYS